VPSPGRPHSHPSLLDPWRLGLHRAKIDLVVGPRMACLRACNAPVVGRVYVSVSVVCKSCWSVLCVVKRIWRFEEQILHWAGCYFSTDSVCTPCLLHPRRLSGFWRGGVGQDAALGELPLLIACGLHVSGLGNLRRVEAGDAAATAADLHPVGPAFYALPRRDDCAACKKDLGCTHRLLGSWMLC